VAELPSSRLERAEVDVEAMCLPPFVVARDPRTVVRDPEEIEFADISLLASAFEQIVALGSSLAFVDCVDSDSLFIAMIWSVHSVGSGYEGLVQNKRTASFCTIFQRTPISRV